MSVDISKIRPGDTVTVLGTVREIGACRILVQVGRFEQQQVFHLEPKEIASHTPKALAVGDRVKALLGAGACNAGRIGTIKAQCDGYYWVQYDPGEDPQTHSAMWLERVQ